MSSATEILGTAPAVQSDYDKLRRIPYLYAFNMLNMAALVCTMNTPLALYAAEMGVERGSIGVLAGIMPFAQVLCIGFLPLVLAHSQRRITALAYASRYFFVLLWLVAPWLGTPTQVFWLLFGSVGLFSISRTLAETAIYPWSQEYTPRQVRGRISGLTSVAILPVALGGSLLIQLWLDSRTGINRFFPIFIIGAGFGLVSVLCLLGLRGGDPRPDSPRGFEAIRAMRTPLRDRNFWLYLYSSGTQYFAYTAVNLFLVLFFRDRLGMTAGELVLLAALVPLGGAIGGLITGWFVDRYGTRAIRVTLQTLQVLLVLALLFVHPGVPAHYVIAGLMFFSFGLLFQSSIAVGSIYMLNYVPPAHKESYMTLAYASDGIIGGGATFLAGLLLQWLDLHQPVMFGVSVDSYELMFVLAAVVVVTSALSFAALREEGATGVRAFFGNFGSGSAIRALMAIPRYGALTSEERRRELTYGFGGTRSALVKEELIEALSDPSFDVRYEAIQSLGRLPPSPAIVRALESMLAYEGLVELQYAALAALGQLGAVESGGRIAQFLESPNALLRARAMRALGDIRDERSLPRIRELLEADPEIDCRLAAVSALGKYGDRPSVAQLVAIYRELVRDDAGSVGEPRSKVVLLALAKILGLEESFSREWRFEQRQMGYRLPGVVMRLAATVRRRQEPEAAALAKQLAATASVASSGATMDVFAALEALAPLLRGSKHADAAMVGAILEGTRDVGQPHRALVILLALSLRSVLAP